jgi:hypothetical protein
MNLKATSYTLMATGTAVFIAGIGVAHFQPSTPLTLSWWMITGGWGIAVIGAVLHAYRVIKLLRRM